MTNGYDQFLRRTNLATLNGSTTLTRAAYAYDYGSRLDTVTDLVPAIPHTAQYTYLANSPLMEQITFATNGTTVMTTTKGYDALNRLTNTVTLDSGLGTLDSHRYAYNTANQRTSVTNAENARWVYTYDSFGQVTGGKKYWNDGTPACPVRYYEPVQLRVCVAQCAGWQLLRWPDGRFETALSGTPGWSGAIHQESPALRVDLL